jgi:two-component system, OmpR family, sensor histidine kinase QseC
MKRQPSLLRHLLAWTLGALLCVWASFVVVGYRTGEHEADELTDGHLASVAALLLSQRQPQLGWVQDPAELGGRRELRAHDYQQSLSIVAWDASGRMLWRTGRAPTPPFASSEGFETLQLGDAGKRWRAFSRWDSPARQHRLMVLLSEAERDDLAEDIAEQVAGPGLWLLPVVALVLALAIKRGLRPLHELGREVHQLDIHRDTTLKAASHQEFEAVVHAINTLVDRYGATLQRERSLASEIAHELRTPLASLSLHASSLRRGLSPEDQAEALRRLELDATRASGVLSDLLALARASRAELAEVARPVDLAALARAVMSEFAQAALDSGHELSLAGEPACIVQGHPLLLELALRNMVENALVHTPPGTRIEASVRAQPPAFEVRDDGRSRAAAGEPMKKSPGLGLGQQVVRKVAALHGGSFDAVVHDDPGLTCWRLSLGAEALATHKPALDAGNAGRPG